MRAVKAHLELGEHVAVGRRVVAQLQIGDKSVSPETWVQTDYWGDEGRVIINQYDLPLGLIDVETLRKFISRYFEHAMTLLAATGQKTALDLVFSQSEPYAPWVLVSPLPAMWHSP